MAQIYLPGVGGWVGGVCYCSIRLSQPSLAGFKAGAELGNRATDTERHWERERNRVGKTLENI